jgi:hypothetical protein
MGENMKTKKSISIDVGGKLFALAYTTAAQCWYEEKRGCNFQSVSEFFDAASDEHRPSLSNVILRDLFRAGLSCGGARPSDIEVCDLIDDLGTAEVFGKVAEAINLAFGDAKPKTEGKTVTGKTEPATAPAG